MSYAVYDTGCFAYEEDGIDQDGIYGPDQHTNGFDDNGIGGIDDVTELEGPIPYPVPLKGIQVKNRVFEPDSRQIREITGSRISCGSRGQRRKEKGERRKWAGGSGRGREKGKGQRRKEQEKGVRRSWPMADGSP